MSTPVNEKTVELDVTAGMLSLIRLRSPAAFAIGYSMRYERVNGLDISIRERSGTLLSFQYKKAYRRIDDAYWFHFNNNSGNDQHNLVYLSASASPRRSSVYYALPAFVTIREVQNASPDFLSRTYLVDPLDVGPINDHVAHRFEADTRRGICHIHSERHRSVKMKTWKELSKLISKGRVGLNLESIDELLHRAENRQSSISISVESGKSKSVRLRGLVF